MRRLIGIAALALLGTAFFASTALAVIETGGTVGRKDYNRQVTKMGGSSPNDSTVYGIKVLSTGSLQVTLADPDRDLDYYETGIISTATLDTATSLWSAPIDLRKYSRFTVIVHIVPGTAAGDTTYAAIYDYGLTMYAPPVLATDWTGYGMPIVTRGSGGRNGSSFATDNADTTAGFFGPAAGTFNSIQTNPGERLIRFRGSAPLASAVKNYVNRSYTHTVRIPGSDLLGPGDRPRFAVFQLRGMKRVGGAAPSIRLDVEALR